MAIRSTPLLPSTVTKTLICLDSTDGNELQGTLLNPYLPGITPFSSGKELIYIMERFFDGISFPQSHHETRSFSHKKRIPSAERPKTIDELIRHFPDDVFDGSGGGLATFILHVDFRHNVSWQGRLEWREAGKKQNFRSILEFLILLDNAAAHTANHPIHNSW